MVKSNILVEYVNCDYCGHEINKILPRGYNYINIICYHTKCLNCSLIYVNPRPTIDELHNIYQVEIEPNQLSNPDPYYRNELINRVKFIKNIIPSGKILDVGCSNGVFMEMLNSMGYKTVGIELSRSAYKFAKDKGLDVSNKSIEESDIQENKFDIIHLGDVLEHLTNPNNIISRIYKILKKDGIVVVSVPTYYSSMRGILTNLLLSIRYYINGSIHILGNNPRHLFEFSYSTLINYFIKHNFIPYKCKCIYNYGRSIECTGIFLKIGFLMFPKRVVYVFKKSR